MVSRTKIILIVLMAAVSFSAGVAAWIVTQPAGWSDAPMDGAAKLSDEERRRQAKEFFGTPKQYDMKNGQEMKPRW